MFILFVKKFCIFAALIVCYAICIIAPFNAQKLIGGIPSLVGSKITESQMLDTG